MVEGRKVGRYVIGPELAAGGMATVHLGRMQGPAGFGKTVAIKRLHAQFAKDAEFSKMFLDEARVTSGLTHPNVVMTLDVLDEADGLYLVMEYVHGVSLAHVERALPRDQKIPLGVSCAIAASFLDGLHAAHEAADDHGAPLGIVHRDVSPQNVLVSFGGIAKIADFGIAKAAGRMHSTGDGSAKGKLSYMAPEQVLSDPVSPRTDVFAAGIVLWECLTRRRLVDGHSAAERLRALLELAVVPPSVHAPEVPPEIDAVVVRALAKSPDERFQSAQEMSVALQRATALARSGEISDWIRRALPQAVTERDRALTDLQKMLAPAYVSTATGPFQPPSSARIVATPTPPSEASAPNVSINDYLTRSERQAVPHKMPRAVLAALIVLPALGVVGVILVLLSFGRTRPPPPAPAAVAVTPQATPPSPAPAPIETASAAAISVDVDDEPEDEAPPPVASASAVPAKRPAAATPAKTKKCRIVAVPDRSGRMKFEEVCGP